MKKLLSVVLMAAMLFGLCSCGSVKTVSHSFSAMDTLMQITFYGATESDTAELYGKLKERTETLDSLFDVNSKTSDTSKINSAKNGEKVTVQSDTALLLKAALKVSAQTGGAFDPTIYPLTALWGFTGGKYAVPSDSEIKAALNKVGCNNITVSGAAVTKRNGAGVDLGGIAKGYLGDELLRMMNESGVAGVLSLGGNIVLAGKKPDGKKWGVAVKDPNDGSKNLCEFQLDGGCSVVTSGGYERYFTENGKTYHHIIDPSTGAPAESDLLSVTVIGKNGTMCDAFSTALYVMGQKKAAAFMKDRSDFEYIFLTTDKKLYVSSGLKDAVTIVDPSTYSFGEV